MKGRKPIPDKLKAARGTLQRCRKRGEIPVLLLDGVPDPPSTFTDTELSVYYDTANELQRNGLMQKIGLPPLVMYCTYMAAAMDAEERIRTEGRVYMAMNQHGELVLKVSPYHRISIEAFSAARALMGEYGITPAAQARLAGMIGKKDEEPNPFDEF